MRSKVPATLFAILAMLAFGLAACGSDDDEGASTDTSEPAAEEPAAEEPAAEEPADEGPETVRVTTIGFCNEFYLWWAEEKGVFEEYGIQIEYVQTAGGSAGLAAIMSDSADFSFTNGFTALLSFSQGFPIRFVSGAYESTVAPTPPANGIGVQTDSDLQGPEDLVGKKVGVNELGGINQIMTSEWFRINGVDPQDVNFVALPFQELAPAVIDGSIDAAQIPAVNILSNPEQLRSLGDPFQEVGKVLFAGYLTTESYLAEHADAAEAFQAALSESVAAVKDPANADEAFAIAGERCNQDPEFLKNSPQQDYTADVDPALLTTMAELLIKEGQLREVPDIETLVPEFARP